MPDSRHADQPPVDADRGRMAPAVPRIDRYAALPDKTRLFIENLRDKDLQHLQAAIEMAEAMSTMGRLTKWMTITAGALATAVMATVAAWNHFFPPNTGH